MLLASGTPDTANPTADQGEALGCPTLLSFAPWQALFFGADGKPKEFKWVYGNMLGSEQTIAAFTDAFETSGVETNKKVGMLFQNDADYKGWMDPTAAPKVFAEKGYTLVVPDPYAGPGRGLHLADHQVQERRLRDHLRHQRPAVVLQLLDPEPAAGLQAQVHQLGQGPHLPAGRHALSQPRASASSARPRGTRAGRSKTPFRISTPRAWPPTSRRRPASSGPRPSAATARPSGPSTSTSGPTNPEDKESVLEAIKTTKGDFQQGHIDFTEPVDPNGFHPIANNYKPYIGAAAVAQGHQVPVEPIVVSNATAPGTTVQDKASRWCTRSPRNVDKERGPVEAVPS